MGEHGKRISVRRTRRRLDAPLALVAAVVLGALLVRGARAFRVVVDDAFIAFRYAENLAAHRGLVFNPGERVEGYTDFLWVVILAAAKALGASTPVAAPILGVAAGVATLGVIVFAARRVYDMPWYLAVAAGLPIALSPLVAFWCQSGLESGVYMLAVTAAATATAVSSIEQRGRGTAAGVAWGVACLVRPEPAGILLATATIYALTHRRDAARAAHWVVAATAIVIPHLVFRRVYYSSWLPNTYYAKAVPLVHALSPGAAYVWPFLVATGLVAAFPMALVAPPGKGRPGHLVLAVTWVFAMGSCVTSGGDFYVLWRFAVPYLPVGALLALGGGYGLLTRVGNAVPWRFPRIRRLRGSFGHAVAMGLCASLLYSAVGSAPAHDRRVIEQMRMTSRLLERYGRVLAARYPASTVIAVSALGQVPYFSGLPTIDMLGLADVHIARQGKIAPDSQPAHRHYDTDYVLERRPQLIVLEFGDVTDAPGKAPPLDTRSVVNSVLAKPHWRALTDLLQNARFQQRYHASAVETDPATFLYYFELGPE